MALGKVTFSGSWYLYFDWLPQHEEGAKCLGMHKLLMKEFEWMCPHPSRTSERGISILRLRLSSPSAMDWYINVRLLASRNVRPAEPSRQRPRLRRSDLPHRIQALPRASRGDCRRIHQRSRSDSQQTFGPKVQLQHQVRPRDQRCHRSSQTNNLIVTNI